MITIRRYRTLLLAQNAAEFLRQNSIDARSSSRIGGDAILGALGHGVHEVLLANCADEPRAEQLLAEWEKSPAQPDAHWEDQSQPDLTRLDPALLPPCPGCSRTLPPDAALTACPACGRAVNIVELILERGGPDALADCYPDQPGDLPDDLLLNASLQCPDCEYALGGLPPEGLCPECGRPYSKADMLRGSSG